MCVFIQLFAVMTVWLYIIPNIANIFFFLNHRHLLGLQNAIPQLNFEKLRLGSDQRQYSVTCQKDIR